MDNSGRQAESFNQNKHESVKIKVSCALWGPLVGVGQHQHDQFNGYNNKVVVRVDRVIVKIKWVNAWK